MNKLGFVFVTLIMLLYADLGFSQPAEYINETESPRNRVLIQTIGIRYKKNDLHSASSLSQYRKSIAEKYIFPGYKDTDGCKVFSLYGDTLSASTIVSCLNSFEDEASSTDVVIIHIIGHGKYDASNDEYSLICSDGSELSGDDLRKYITTMSGKGALVVIFLDTCHSGAIFKKGENGSHFGNNGGVALFAAAQRQQDAIDLGQSKFSNTIFEVLKTNKSLTLGKIAKKIGEQYGIDSIAIEKQNDIKTGQNPYVFFFPKNRKLEGYKIQDYPIIRPVVSDGGANNRFYGGIALGANHTITPFADVNIGVGIKRWKIEAGASLAFTKSDDVHLYDNNGFMQNAYNYLGYIIYGRLGYNVAKKDSRWEMVPLAGISGNFIKGSHIKDFNNSIGETAGSLMLPLGFRVAYDLCKNNKRNLLVHGTIGCDIPLYKDNNVKVLEENKFVKNWCSFRPHIEVGLIVKFFNF